MARFLFYVTQMRIGIFPSLDASSGGIYQYSLTILEILNQWGNNRSADSIVLFAEDVSHTAVTTAVNGYGCAVQPLHRPSARLNALRRLVGEGPHRRMWWWLRTKLSEYANAQESILPDPDCAGYRPEMNQWFRDCGVELMIYPAPTSLSFEARIPYVMAIHDLQHRLQPEFPEVSSDGEWERREYRYRNGARYATLLLADSEVGKEDILRFYGPYGVTADRVKVLPYLPACYLAADVSESERRRVRAIYDLPERYLFYPAQFWPHKNHLRIVEALGRLNKERNLKASIVFCGSHTGELRERIFHEVMSQSAQWGLEKHVRYLGYVPDEHMSGLYAEAVALVMPTFFGPTNIPVLEAWAFGCPVLTSDIHGIREQAQDAAILVDPRSVDAIAEGIYRCWMGGASVEEVVKSGRQRLASYTPDHYRQRLVDILEEARARVAAEKHRERCDHELTRE